MNSLVTNAILSLPLVGAFSMFAVGIVVIYRASNVLNLAHGAMAALPAYVAFGLVQTGMPKPLAFVLSVASGALLGIIVETGVLKPLRSESQTTQTVATVAVLGVIIAGIALIWGTAPQPAPNMFPEGGIPVGFTDLEYSGIGLFIVASIAAAVLALVFQKTNIGLMMRAAADNPRAAVLMGIDPNKTTRLAWAIGGALAGAAGVLLAGATILHPYTLARQVLPAFVAALIGGLGNIYGALVGSLIVGLTQGVVSSIGPLADRSGSSQLVLAIMAMVVLAVRGKAIVGTTESRGGGAKAGTRKLKMTRTKLLFGALMAPAIIAWPFLPVPPWLLADANLAAIFTMVGVSLVILTGWVGQISLSQAAFVGVSAFVTGILTREAGIHFPLNLPIAAASSALVAAGLGFVALRVRGLYLAVATLIFGWMADEFLFKSEWLVGPGGSSTITSRIIGRPTALPSFDLTDRRTFWFVAFAGALVAIAIAANLRDSKIGRSFFAIRGSEMAAASLGIDVVRTKLAAFAISGLLAGLAGNLIMIDQRTATPAQFSFSSSLFFLSMAVIGGTGSLAGVTAAAIFFAALSGVAETIPALGRFLELFSTSLLLVAVLLSPSSRRKKVAALASAAMMPIINWRSNRAMKVQARPVVQRSPKTDLPPLVVEDEVKSAAVPTEVPLAVEHVTVRFGGLVASNDVSLQVEQGQIVGLIGPNGAGKTTIFNAISGFVKPTEGKVFLFEKDVTGAPVHQRSALGLGRTFQALQLFNDATVFENLMVATHLQMKTTMLSHLFITQRALKAEHSAEDQVREVISLAGLQDVSDRRAGDLPFGILRMVEVARAMVTGANFIMLDEPASGLDDRETDALGKLLLRIRSEMGRSLLLVEHDVRFVTALSDQLFVLDRGTIISSGPAAQVRDDPVVIAAYLGGSSEDDLAEVGA